MNSEIKRIYYLYICADFKISGSGNKISLEMIDLPLSFGVLESITFVFNNNVKLWEETDEIIDLFYMSRNY